MERRKDEPIRKPDPSRTSRDYERVEPIDGDPATQRPYDPGFDKRTGAPEDDPWVDTGEVEQNG